MRLIGVVFLALFFVPFCLLFRLHGGVKWANACIERLKGA